MSSRPVRFTLQGLLVNSLLLNTRVYSRSITVTSSWLHLLQKEKPNKAVPSMKPRDVKILMSNLYQTVWLPESVRMKKSTFSVDWEQYTLISGVTCCSYWMNFWFRHFLLKTLLMPAWKNTFTCEGGDCAAVTSIIYSKSNSIFWNLGFWKY